MKPGAIIAKTIPFMLIRLAVYLVFFIGICIYVAICVGILGLFKDSDNPIGLILFFAFTGGGWAIYRFVREYITYMIKAAHVAVIAHLAIYGQVPDGFSMYNFGVEKVKKQFVTANVLFGLDRLVAGAVSQIQRALGGIGSMLSFIPGVEGLMKVLQMFVEIVLSYVDECIMAMIFLKPEQNVWKTAADSIVLYVQNWKTILKTGGMILIGVLAFLLVFWLATFGIFNAMFGQSSDMGGVIATIVTVVFGLIIKAAVLDPIIMVHMMVSYLGVAYNGVPAVDLYQKVQGMSKKFNEIVGKAGESMGYGAQGGAAGGAAGGPVG